MPTLLICTVGGSHQPIVSAITAQKPDYVIFICTGPDPATGRPGSSIQIDGKGNCIKAQPQDDKPSLPNIPSQTGLGEGQYEIRLTLSDDLDRIYLDCSQAIADLISRFGSARLIADYTGGTKSMSAGLITAALENPDIELQLVTGGRSDLIKVHDGWQYSTAANSEQIRFERQIAPYRQAWSRYAYSEAEAGLAQLAAPKSSQLRGQFSRFKDLSHAFAEWDNFNHVEALTVLNRYAPSLNDTARIYLGIAKQLNDPTRQNQHKREAARLFDLYLNAQRRAAQGRYDDAIARVYRLIEWTAQWLLKTHCNLDTANVAPEAIPEGLSLTQNREGQWQAGLFVAWQLVKLKTTGPAAEFIRAQENTLLNHIKTRNASILAHGFEPVSAAAWQPLHTWLEQAFMPMLQAEAAKVGIKAQPAQLPTDYNSLTKP